MAKAPDEYLAEDVGQALALLAPVPSNQSDALLQLAERLRTSPELLLSEALGMRIFLLDKAIEALNMDEQVKARICRHFRLTVVDLCVPQACRVGFVDEHEERHHQYEAVWDSGPLDGMGMRLAQALSIRIGASAAQFLDIGELWLSCAGLLPESFRWLNSQTIR